MTTTSTQSSSFIEFPKVARLNRESILTEKIDGTNAQVFIWDELHTIPSPDDPEVMVSAGPPPSDIPFLWSDEGIHVAAGSRTRWITPSDDNCGFAAWVEAHIDQLVYLRHGRHFGEWWGSGIQRGYGLTKGEKRWSLFNVARWALHGTEPARIPTGDPRIVKMQDVLPACVGLVPVLYRGLFSTESCSTAIERLRTLGSVASPGFMRPEGIVCFHTAANVGFKWTLEKDDVPKSLVG